MWPLIEEPFQIFGWETFFGPWLGKPFWFLNEQSVCVNGILISIVKTSSSCGVNFCNFNRPAAQILLILNILWIFLKVFNFLRHWVLSWLVVMQLEHSFLWWQTIPKRFTKGSLIEEVLCVKVVWLRKLFWSYIEEPFLILDWKAFFYLW